jgi:predicted enzyme related to lactoylglutathione lyase
MTTAPTRNNRIDYIEFPAKSANELAAAKQFYAAAFGWIYKDWGSDYADTQSSGVSTGINADPSHQPRQALVVVYAESLEESRARVVAANGRITKDIFSFPGGRRFHFLDPAGNELAVWSEQ